MTKSIETIQMYTDNSQFKVKGIISVNDKKINYDTMISQSLVDKYLMSNQSLHLFNTQKVEEQLMKEILLDVVIKNLN